MPLTADDIAALYDAHARAFVAYFARRVLDPEAAVDLTAETFAAAFVNRAQYRGDAADGDADAVGWIYGIARNQVAMYFRAGAVERRAVAKLGVERPELTEPEFERIEELAELADLRRRVASELAAMAHEHAEPLRLRVVDELGYDEIAARLGISEQTARARVSRALRALAVRLAPYLPIEEPTNA